METAAEMSVRTMRAAGTQRTERILSLDALRGFDMFWIVGGGGLVRALWLATGWQLFRVLDAQLEHVKWVGFHFYDLILPLFMFIVGAVIPYALVSRIERGEPKPSIYRKIFTRFVLLFIFGLVYNQGWHRDWAHPLVGSVLGEIGFGYLFASLIVVHTRKLRPIVIWISALLLGVGLLHFLLPVPGYGAGVFTMRGSANAYLDRTFLPGDLFWYMTPNGTVYENVTGEPMGPNAVPVADVVGILNWVSAISITLMGVVAGLVLRNQTLKPYRKVLIFLVTGVGCVLSALALRGWYPIIKNMQTGTFCLLSGGLSFLLVALFYLVIDIWKLQRWAFFFTVIGMNAIALYMGVQFINVSHTSDVLVGGLAIYLGGLGPVLLSAVSVGLMWISGYILYRNKIFLRV